MEHKRTPGNWFAAHDSRGFAVETERVRIVNLGHSDECAEADAYLMAAAPDLLAALQAVVAISVRDASRSGYLIAIHSLPTRRSSDLDRKSVV